MFVSFCLAYAQVPEIVVPWESGVNRWIADLRGLGLYAEFGEYEPKPGDLVFYNLYGDT